MNYLTFNQRMFLVLVVRFLPNVLEPMTIWATQMWKISPASTKALIVSFFVINEIVSSQICLMLVFSS